MKLRVGIVGLGEHWESRHLPALSALSDRYEVRAICDPVWHRAERAARQLGAHPVGGFPINAHIHMLIPVGRAINPISQTNWEGIGVTPDIQAPEEQALDIAQRLALKAVLEQIGEHPSGPLEDLAREARAALAALEEEVGDESQLA